MLLNVQLKQMERIRGTVERGEFCWDDCIATFANWIGRDYELMYIGSWNFKSNQYNKMMINPSKGMEYKSNKKYDKLEFYHGIKMTKYDPTLNNHTFEIITNELKENRPVILTLDCFYCPWDLGFQNFHNNGHSFLVTGIDDSQNLYCSDPYFWVENYLLSLNYLDIGFKGFITFSLIDFKEHNLINLLRTSVNNYLKSDIVTQMRNYGDFIGYSFDAQTELQEGEDLAKSQLWQAFKSDLYGRIEYAIVVKYVLKKSGFSENNVMKMFNRFLDIIEGWQVAKGMLVKILMTKESQRIRERFAFKLKGIADDEAKFALDLLEFLNIEMNHNVEPEIVETNKEFNLDNIGRDVIYVDLSSYCNNQGFGTLSTNCTADLTGTGHYFILKDLPMNEIWRIENTSFKLSLTDDQRFDNISCLGQKITTPLDCFRYIMILGCAEYGDFKDYLHIFYSSGETGKVLIKFTDWFTKPHFGEKIAWEGNIAFRNNNEVNISEQKYNLFVQVYPLNSNQPLSSIILPECPNLHLFAITLGK